MAIWRQRAFGSCAHARRVDRVRHCRVRGRRAVPPSLLGDPRSRSARSRQPRSLSSRGSGCRSASPRSSSRCRSCTPSATLGSHATRSQSAWTRTPGSPATRRSPAGIATFGRPATRCTCCVPAWASTRTRTRAPPIPYLWYDNV